MTTYLIVIFLVSLLSLLYNYFNNNKIYYISGNIGKYNNVLLLSLIIFILTFVAGFRYEVGTDYWAYRHNYPQYVESTSEFNNYFNEPGIKILAYFSSLFFNHYGTMFLFASIITIPITVYTIYKHTNLLFTSILLYIFIGAWHGSFNGVRQYIACAILFFGHKYILKKDFKKYSFIVILAGSFHISSLIAIFFYFLPQRRLKSKEIIYLTLTAIIIIFSSNLIYLLISFIENFRNTQFILNEYMLKRISPLRILVSGIPVYLYLLSSKKNVFTNSDYFYINMMLLNFLIFLSSYNSAYLNRFSIYTNIYIAIGIPIILKGYLTEEVHLVNFLILVFYFLFWLTEIKSSANLYNFKWIFMD